MLQGKPCNNVIVDFGLDFLFGPGLYTIDKYNNHLFRRIYNGRKQQKIYNACWPINSLLNVIEVILEDYLGVFLIIWAIAINYVWFSAKHLADSNGLKVSWWVNHWLDFSNMATLMRTDTSPQVRRRAAIYLFSLICLCIAPFIIFKACRG
ncbi:hypothetical protein SIN8267_01404 [Sinobacterium norvegicum]|uniref:Uncharacterized protein n=1 Tax=Sinobacterium norvegicum TaxID=1641715 RepID=A0ABM9ADK7_9GAMM|nr:hypothetical protein SIN8267_01404 [Sinobacterium norvegicum]